MRTHIRRRMKGPKPLNDYLNHCYWKTRRRHDQPSVLMLLLSILVLIPSATRTLRTTQEDASDGHHLDDDHPSMDREQYSNNNNFFYLNPGSSIVSTSHIRSSQSSSTNLRGGLIEHSLDHHRLRSHSSEAIFDTSTLKNITIASGKTAYLPCRVRHLADRTISWIRKSDLHVLTVGKMTYTSDERFKAIHLDNSDDWTLQIRFPTQNDQNDYVCQVSGTKANHVVRLNVVLSSAKIMEGTVVYLTSGSNIELTCSISDAPGYPDYIFWHHNGEAIRLDSPRVHVQSSRTYTPTAQHPVTSKLIIEKSHPSDSGNYSCIVTPTDFAEAAHVAVHVLANGGQTQAQIIHGKRSTTDESSSSSSSSSPSSSASISSFLASKSFLILTLLIISSITSLEYF